MERSPDIRLSLVIPFYRSEDFIKTCLDSVARQIPSNCEVVLVNDGSADRSVEIIEREFGSYISTGQFSIIRIENSGPGTARNVGVEAAQGEYVGFLDSDDVLLPGYFRCLMPSIEESAIDLIQFNCTRFHTLVEIDRAPTIRSHSSLGCFALEEVRNEIFGFGTWFPCNRVYRREILQSAPFVEGEFYEDFMTIPMIFLKDYSIELKAERLIGYRYNPSSTTSNHTRAHAETLLAFLIRLDSMPPSTPLSLLKIQVSRGLSYFKIELGLDDFPDSTVLGVVKNIRSTQETLRHLKYADRLFFQFPRVYSLVNWLRVKRAR